MKNESNVSRALKLFIKAKKMNPYLYFELAYTKPTEWMAWVIDKEGGNRNVLCQSQAATPEGACAEAVKSLLAYIARII